MSWNYRVIEFVELGVGPFRQVHEVYYDEDGRPVSYSEGPAVVVWDAGEEGGGYDILQKMARALDKPTLVEMDFITARKGEE